MPDLSITTLGGLTMRRDRNDFRPPTRKAAALLVYLGLSPRGSRSREQLAGVFWGRSADEQSRASLRQTLSSLRKALDTAADLLQSDAESVGVDRDRLEIDVLEFEALANSASQADQARAAELYQGAFLEGFSLNEDGFEEWLTFTRQQYSEIALQLFTRLVEHHRMLREYETAVRYAQRLLALDPLQEQTHRLLMELFTRLGRREQALLQFDECERILKSELKVEPAAETREIYSMIRSGAVLASQPSPGELQESAPPVFGTRSGKPGIAVLPFENMSGDSSQQFLADAITEDLVSNLAHDLWFDVIARTSTQKFRDNKSGTADIAAELGARYIVDGSLRKADDRFRISVVLIDGADGRQIWDQRYDRVATDLFALQEEIAISIAAAVIPEVNSAEQRSAMRKHPRNLDAWSCCHKAFAHLYTFELAELELAHSLFEQAIEHDPSYSQPYAGLAYSQMMTVWYDSSKRELLETANENAHHAIQLDNRDSWAHFALGRILSMQGQYDAANLELEAAIELNPSFGRAYFGLASVAVYSGHYQAALEPIDTAIRLSPADPHLWTFYNIKSRALTGLEQYEEAEYWARKAVREPSATFWADLALVCVLGYLGRDNEAQLAIQDLHRKKPGYSIEQYERDGFVLAAEPHRLAVEGLRRAGLPEHHGENRVIGNKPSIAVLPFGNLSGDPAQQYFSDGFSEEVLNGLTRILSFKVIARNSSFAFRDSVLGAAEIGRQLGARYLVDGSLRKAGGQLRVAVQLVDSETDSQIWSDRYDGALDDIFDLQDRITAAVIGAIEPKIRASEIEKTRQVPHLGAYELYLEALSRVYEMTRESTDEALSLLEQAIELDGEFNRALSLAAWCCTLRPTQGWLSRDSDEARQAVDKARRSLAGAPDDPEVLWQAGYSIWFFSEALHEGVDHVDRSLELNPNSAQAWVASGWVRLFSGYPQAAIEHHSRAIELSPMDPIGYRPMNGIAAAYICLGDYAQAEQWSRKALALGPNYHGCYRVLATALAYLGRTDEAAGLIQKYRELAPEVSVAHYRRHMPWKDAHYREINEEGLRRAGLPEEV